MERQIKVLEKEYNYLETMQKHIHKDIMRRQQKHGYFTNGDNKFNEQVSKDCLIMSIWYNLESQKQRIEGLIHFLKWQEVKENDNDTERKEKETE